MAMMFFFVSCSSFQLTVYISKSNTCVWCKPASSLELPYTIKRNGDSTLSKDGSRAKKPLSPPPTVAPASSTAASGQRKKPASASKNKSSGWLACRCRCSYFSRCRLL